jgi:heme-degrading monooxygenase HmoA
MVRYIWEFIARADRLEEFERHYASSGAWAELFRKGAGYRGTQLLRDADNPRRYLSIDSWETAGNQRVWRERFAAQYEELDRACEAFTESERNIGIFEEE